MASIETSRSIDAPQTQVWDVVADPRKFEQWNTLHTRWQGEAPTELALGSQVTEVVSIMKIPNTVDFTAVAFEPPHRVSLEGKGTGGMKVSLTFSVIPDGEDKAVASIKVDVAGALLFGPMGKRIEKTLVAELDTSLGRIAEMLQAPTISG
ncbi:MAG: SRPBCC family protein [Mycobacterium sp.]|nr:SRPBCC family protein [Mycobacterium sp.]